VVELEQSRKARHAGLHGQIELRAYPGKTRPIGSAAPHLSFPLIVAGLFGTIESPSARTWDIAGAHAVHRSPGVDVTFLDGRRTGHAALTNGSSVSDIFLARSRQRADAPRKVWAKL
jgi:fructose-1,6-bisphosphatase/inositol monophosphatase family enzyme